MSSHFPLHTPEALLGRNDSKNPATTCQGITGSGRPCRRALASPKASPVRRRGSSIPAPPITEDTPQGESSYCWQHKNQVQESDQGQSREDSRPRLSKGNGPANSFSLQERSSIDTLVQRLGIDSTEHGRRQRRQKIENIKLEDSRPVRREHALQPRSQQTKEERAPRTEKHGFVSPERLHKKKPRGFWASLCCIDEDEGDYVEIVRHRKRAERTHRPTTSEFRQPTQNAPSCIPPPRSSRASLPTGPTSTLPIRPLPQQRSSSNSQTTHLLSLIPQHLSPQITSLLLTELTKPISPHDEEGYIYIFWLTPQSRSTPAESTVRSLLTPPSQRPHHTRRISDVMSEYSSTAGDAAEDDDGSGRKTIKLKIGRANNVTRRMKEWQRQCGYELNLVRWYPYISSSSPSSPETSPVNSTRERADTRVEYPDLSRPPPPPAATATNTARRESGISVRKVACVKRVERLVHLELSDKQVKRQCEVCGREHREWFEIEASQAGVRGVDECVRRWIAWGEERMTGEG